jgi:hypothetical protein
MRLDLSQLRSIDGGDMTAIVGARSDTRGVRREIEINRRVSLCAEPRIGLLEPGNVCWPPHDPHELDLAWMCGSSCRARLAPKTTGRARELDRASRADARCRGNARTVFGVGGWDDESPQTYESKVLPGAHRGAPPVQGGTEAVDASLIEAAGPPGRELRPSIHAQTHLA